jgi:hypothetical protein
MHDIELTVARIKSVLSPDLLKPKWYWHSLGHPYAGHCYAASEALYHMCGGKDQFVPQLLTNKEWRRLPPGETHWFLKTRSGDVVDITQDQFGLGGVPHANSRGCGFLTKEPSKRAREIIRRLTRIT